MSYDIDAFLEHHGVKGQKWGIRNYKTGSNKHKNETPAQRRARQRKNIQRVKLATGLGITALYVTALLKADGKRKASVLNRKNSIRRDPHDGREMWDIHIKHDPNIIRMQERQRNGAYQLKEYFKRQGLDVVEGGN